MKKFGLKMNKFEINKKKIIILQIFLIAHLCILFSIVDIHFIMINYLFH